MAYRPLGPGFLGGVVTSRKYLDDWRRLLPRYSEENFPKAVAEKKGVTKGQVTLAWLMAQWEDVIPIPGELWLCALEENVEAMKVKLTKKEIKEIRKACENAGDPGKRYPDM